MSDQRTTMNGKPVFTVPNKTIINFDSGFAPKLLCDGSTFTAGTSCPYSCSFCYVEAQMNKQKPWLEKNGVTGDHMDIVVRRANAVEIARKQLESHSSASRQERKIIYASPLTDVAANMELVRETVEICKVILELTNWDIRLLSKSNLLPRIAIALKEWEEMEGYKREMPYTKGHIIYGVSTGTLDDKLAAAFEEGTPKVSKRIESLHWLQDNGFRTFGMICPSLPQWFPGHEDIDAYIEFSRQICAAIRVEKCEHVWAEVINVRGESFTRTEKALYDGGYSSLAQELFRVSHDKAEWEKYARFTFAGHARFVPASKLRFLQYVNASNLEYWKLQERNGAVLLGSAIHDKK